MGGQYRKILDTVVQRQIDAAGPDAKLHGRVVLIDLDNTVVDWDKEFVARYGSSGGGGGGGEDDWRRARFSGGESRPL